MNPIETIRTDGGDVSIFRTMGFIGDSLSSGEHEGTDEQGNRTYWDYMEYSWGQFIARKCGLTGYNFSRGGLMARTFLNDYINLNSPYEIEKRCQAYVIALGVNDMHHLDQYPGGFGSFDDVDWDHPENCKDSYVGKYVEIILRLRAFAPSCRIFVMTPAREEPEGEDQREKYEKVCDFLRSLPEKFDFLYVLDLRKYGPTYDMKFHDKYWLGGHMNALGYKFTADLVCTYITHYINEKPDEFAQVGFLYKGLHNNATKW